MLGTLNRAIFIGFQPYFRCTDVVNRQLNMHLVSPVSFPTVAPTSPVQEWQELETVDTVLIVKITSGM